MNGADMPETVEQSGTDVPRRADLELEMDAARDAWHVARQAVDDAAAALRRAMRAQIETEMAFRAAVARYEAERRQAC
jgi:hypothetical protein